MYEMNRRPASHTSDMRRTAHKDVTGLTVVYAFLLGLIVAGRWGWWGLTVYALVVVPLLSVYCFRRGAEYRSIR